MKCRNGCVTKIPITASGSATTSGCCTMRSPWVGNTPHSSRCGTATAATAPAAPRTWWNKPESWERGRSSSTQNRHSGSKTAGRMKGNPWLTSVRTSSLLGRPYPGDWVVSSIWTASPSPRNPGGRSTCARTSTGAAPGKPARRCCGEASGRAASRWPQTGPLRRRAQRSVSRWNGPSRTPQASA